jgi:predicted Zn-dependent peptidase
MRLAGRPERRDRDVTVKISELPNGLIAASDTMDGAETVTMGAWVGAGARHEPAAVNGIAHLLEHMAFKGTDRRSAFEIASEIEEVGGHLNAYTSRESTAYFVKVLAGDLALATDIVADILQHPLFDEEELARERNVVLQEIGQAKDTPDDIIFDHFQAAAYPKQGLGRPVLGEPDIVRRLSRDDLLAYLRCHYGPKRMVVAAAGAVEHETFTALVERSFDALNGAENGDIEAASYLGGEYREERDLEQAHLLMGFPSEGLLDDGYYAANLLSTLLGGGMSSRLFQEVREKHGLAYSIYSFNTSFLDGGLFGIYAGTGEEQVGELTEIVAKELRGLRGSLTAKELASAQAQMRASYLMSRENTSSRCEQLAQQLLTYGRPLACAEIVERIEAVSLSDVADLCDRIFRGPLTLASIGPVGGLVTLEELGARFD